jgi:type IV secretory pathway TraG/TraD family ATPase VirD4
VATSIREFDAEPDGVSAPLGTAQWMPADEVRAKFSFDTSLFGYNADGLWEGRANGQIWAGQLLENNSIGVGYRDDRHILLVSGPRGGKGTSIIIPNLCYWPGSCIVIDPKGENATVTARRRGAGSAYTYGLGQKVHILDPFGEIPLETELKARFNPLDAIKPNSDLAVDDAGRIASALVVIENRNDPFWEQAARNLIKSLILHVLTSREYEGRRNLVTVWRLLRQGAWLRVERAQRAKQENIPSGFTMLWHEMRLNGAYSGLIAGEAQQMLDMHERTRSGILKVAATATEFIDGPPMQRLLEASDFDLGALKSDQDDMTLYLTLPQRYMSTHFRWLRLMVSLAIGEMESIKGRPATGYPTLFVLDEFAGLQRMEAVEHAAAQAAGFGVKFLFVLQNLPQLKEIYNEAWETFIGNSGLRLFFQIEDNFTRSYLAQQLGEHEAFRKTRSKSRSDSTSTGTTKGQSSSSMRGTNSSLTQGENFGQSSTATSGSSGGGSYSYKGFFIPYGRSSQTGHSTSQGISNNEGWSQSATTGHSQSVSESISVSQSHTQSRSNTKGWNEAVHKRLLLNPDEIGLFLARVDEKRHPSYPGIALALVPGTHPIPVRRVNYFESSWFDGMFDPHPHFPPPPTLAERIDRLRALREQQQRQQIAQVTQAPAAPIAPAVKQPKNYFRVFAAAALVLIVIAAVGWAGFSSWREEASVDLSTTVQPTPSPVRASYRTLQGVTDEAWDMAFSPDGRFLAAMGRQNRIVTLWNVESGEAVHALAHDDNVIAANFTPDGQSLVTVNNVRESKTYAFTIWDVASGNINRRSNEWIFQFLFAPVGNIFAATTSVGNGIVVIREFPSVRILHKLSGHTKGVSAFAYTSDGSRLASAGKDNTIKLWDVSSGELIRSMQGFYEPGVCPFVNVFSLAFSRDDRTLASGDCRTISFWDSTTGELLKRIRIGDFPVIQVGFAPRSDIFAAIQNGELLI